MGSEIMVVAWILVRDLDITTTTVLTMMNLTDAAETATRMLQPCGSMPLSTPLGGSPPVRTRKIANLVVVEATRVTQTTAEAVVEVDIKETSVGIVAMMGIRKNVHSHALRREKRKHHTKRRLCK